MAGTEPSPVAVLLDAGGLTNDWTDIEKRLDCDDQFGSPHVRLGLEMTLRERPDISQRFDAHWSATVNSETIRRHWPPRTPAG